MEHWDRELVKVGIRMAGATAKGTGNVPVAHGHVVEAVKPAIDRLGHPALDDLGERPAAEWAVAFAPLKPLRLHLLHQGKGHG